MHTLTELRSLERARLEGGEDVAVLVVGLRKGGKGIRQFRTNTQEGHPEIVPPLSAVAVDDGTLVLPMAKRDKSPYEGFYFVGRAPTADLVLDDPSISKSHAAFQHEGTLWFVKDARSRNGTYVDGRRLQSGARAEIESGSQITFGGIATYFVGLARLRRLVDAG
jgi:hypothetical protein